MQKRSVAGKPEGAEGNKEKNREEEKKTGRDRGKREETSRQEEGKLHKDGTLRCAARLDVTREKISRGWNSGCARVCASLCTCIPVSRTRRRVKEAAGSEWHARKTRPNRRKPCRARDKSALTRGRPIIYPLRESFCRFILDRVDIKWRWYELRTWD